MRAGCLRRPATACSHMARTEAGAGTRPMPLRIACLASVGDDGLAVALGDGEIRDRGRPLRRSPLSRRPVGPLHHRDGRRRHAPLRRKRLGDERPGDWQRDLLERNASGSLWRIDLESGTGAQDRRRSRLACRHRGCRRAASSFPKPGSTAWSRLDLTRPERRRCCSPTCRPIPDASRRRPTATGWRCSRRAASWSSSCCASRPIASG